MFAICLQTKKFENKIVEKPCKIRKSLCKHFCKQYKVGIRANFFIYSIVNGKEIIMADVTVQKRKEVYQYKFEIASIDGKRKFKNKSGFATKSEAKQAGIIAYNEYLNTGHSFKPKIMSYSDYLDYWMKEYCEINLKYHTIEAYKNIIKNHIKPKLGFYRLYQITTATIQEFVNNTYVEYGYSKNFMKNILKVLKTSFSYATDVVGFVKENPTIKVKLPKYDKPDEDPVHIFTKEEIDTILNRFKKNHCEYYAMLTAYHTGLRISEVYRYIELLDELEEIKNRMNHLKRESEKNEKLLKIQDTL